MDVIEMDAASDRVGDTGIDRGRALCPGRGRFKIYIIDESAYAVAQRLNAR